MYNKIQFYYTLPARYADVLRAKGVTDVFAYCKQRKAESDAEQWTIDCLLDNRTESMLKEPHPPLKQLDKYLDILKDQLYWAKKANEAPLHGIEASSD